MQRHKARGLVLHMLSRYIPSLWRATTSEARQPTEPGGGLADEGTHGHDQAHLHIARCRSATSGRGAMGAIPSLWWDDGEGMFLTVPGRAAMGAIPSLWWDDGSQFNEDGTWERGAEAPA